MKADWNINGVPGRGQPPPVAGNYSGKLLIVATGRGVWDDLQALGPWPGDVMAINFIGVTLPLPLTHWCSVHGEMLEPARRLRQTFWEKGARIHTHSVPIHGGADFIWDLAYGGGTSSLLAAMVGLALGYEQVVLAGCPLDNSGHFYDPPDGYLPNGISAGARNENGTWSHFICRSIELDWKRIEREVFQGRVRALSGRPRQWFGAPDGIA